MFIMVLLNREEKNTHMLNWVLPNHYLFDCYLIGNKTSKWMLPNWKQNELRCYLIGNETSI